MPTYRTRGLVGGVTEIRAINDLEASSPDLPDIRVHTIVVVFSHKLLSGAGK
jgi:hypothetical protein